ncbi:hypothetical protein KSP39_PZI023819 [Platanthera zijinensis]|uniref:CP12 domain-containing protein n=1 Tax=Platanthera zijinensis TaxID=2320716 RepID=A0AAP0FU33_9ASPA
MATFLSGVSLSALRISSSAADVGRPAAAATALPQKSLLFATGGRPAKRTASLTAARSAPSTPGGLSEKVSESIKKAEEACGENTESGECAAAWDEVEELSAAASHARDRAKENSDPLETYCNDNPETDECRTYDS